MSMRVRRSLLSSAALALVLTVVGCAEDEPEPIMPDPTTSSPTSAPSEEETEEPETAEEFIRRWTAEALRAQTTGDTKAYRRMTKPCEACQSFADRVDAIYRDGGRVKLDQLVVVRVTQQAKGVNEFLVIRRAGETQVLDASGAVQDSFSGGREPVSVYLTKDDDGQWLVRETLSN